MEDDVRQRTCSPLPHPVARGAGEAEGVRVARRQERVWYSEVEVQTQLAS